MSGIFGFTTKRSDAGRAELHALDVWNSDYGHEGSGTVLSGHMGAGCHTEHFSDRFPAGTPVQETERYVAVVDALLFNRDELLPILGVSEDISDEELLLKWIEARGFDGLKDINGDFAGAIYDREQGSWTLFRDHSGVRPLYYYLDENLFAFSTDIRGLTALPEADLSINELKFFERMAGYNDLTLCNTEYARINCIRPASWTVVTPDDQGYALTEHVYFSWRQKNIRLGSDEEYQRELRRLITDAVRRRCDAVPGRIGCELSGGLDSSIIAILISRLGREGRFFSWSYSPEEVPLMEGRDERKIILDICRQEGIRCHYSQRDESRNLHTVMAEATVPSMNTYSLTKGSRYVAGEGCRVMFTGHGGDEGVSHRCNFYELWLHREYFSFFRNIYRQTGKTNLRLLRTAKNVYHQFTKVHPHFAAPFHKVYSNPEIFLKKEFLQRMRAGHQPKVHYFAFRPYRYIMQGGQRVRLDNIAMQGAGAGVRYLAPFIDYRVLDFALSIPRAQFHNGYTNRYIFRYAFRDLMPQSLWDMHYKDTPSMDNYTPNVDFRRDFQERKDMLMQYIRRDYWKDYLDFDSIDAFTLPENYTRIQYVNACYMLSDLTTCCLIQRLPEKSKERSEAHE